MLISFFIIPTFATEINNPATCDSGTLSTDTGPTNLRANYESNTLNLKWYDENDNLLTVPSASNTCTYGGTINLPEPPHKKGYTFKGWKVVFDLSALDSDIGCVGGSVYNSYEHTWISVYSYGTISGRSLCSVTSGTPATAGVPDENTPNGKYCWCRADTFSPSDSNILYEKLVPSSWVFAATMPSTNETSAEDFCANRCTDHCLSYICLTNDPYFFSFRRALFGQSGS